MACHLFAAKPVPEGILPHCWFDPWEQASVKLWSKYKLFIHEIAPENVICEIAAMLSRGRWVNTEGTTGGCIYDSHTL